MLSKGEWPCLTSERNDEELEQAHRADAYVKREA